MQRIRGQTREGMVLWAYAMDAKRKFKGLLARIFSDAVADDSERDELKAFVASRLLTDDEVKEVVADFVETTWKITIADGVVSDKEKQRLREIVAVLALPPDSLPAAWTKALE